MNHRIDHSHSPLSDQFFFESRLIPLSYLLQGQGAVGSRESQDRCINKGNM